MAALKKSELAVTSQQLLEILAKHFGVDAEKHHLRPRFRFAEGKVGPAGDMHPGIILGMAELSLEPNRSSRKSTAKKSAVKE